MADLFSHAQLLGPDGKLVASGSEKFLNVQRRAVSINPNTGNPQTKHITTNVIIEVDDIANQATARSYFTVLQPSDGFALQPIIAGRYLDQPPFSPLRSLQRRPQAPQLKILPPPSRPLAGHYPSPAPATAALRHRHHGAHRTTVAGHQGMDPRRRIESESTHSAGVTVKL